MIRKPSVYNGRSVSSRSIESFVSKSFSSYITAIATIDEFDKHISSNDEKVVAMFSTTHVKASIPMILKSIAFEYTGRGVSFLHMNNGEKDLLSHASVSSEDKLTVRMPDGSLKVFSGDLKKSEEVKRFFDGFTSPIDSNGEKNNSKAEQEDFNRFKSPGDLEKFILETVDHTVLLAVYDKDIENEMDESVLKTMRNKVSEGMIQYKELKCSDIDINEDFKLVSEICSSSNKLPYLLTIPYGDQSRKKMSKSLNRFKFGNMI